jgi:hypothetical protein
MSLTIPTKLAGLLAALRGRGEVRRAGDEWRARCPAHDDRGPSLYVGLSLDRRCVLLNCRAGCDAEDVVAALGLGLDDLFVEDDPLVEVDARFEAVGEGPCDGPDPAGPGGDGPGGPTTGGPTEPAGPDARHAVYSAFLEGLPLTEAHRAGLRRRGLADPDIDRFGYRTLGRFALNQAVGRLRGRFDEATLAAVPGFRRDRGRVRFADLEGLAIPVRDAAGRVVALKARRDGDGDGGGPKYVWVSSAGGGGPSPGSPPHVPLGTPAAADTARLTEGELKADVTWALSGVPTLGVPGVTGWRAALPAIKAMGVTAVLLAFDADARTKPGVARELAGCAEGLIAEGLEVRLEVWDPARGKGVDDLLAAGGRPEVVTGQPVLPAIARLTRAALGPADDGADWAAADPAGSVAPFPVDCLPAPVAAFVTEAARAIQCPPDFLGVAALTVAAAAVGGARRLRVRRGYEEGARLYAAVVAPPGSAKSPALRAACAPVYAQQQRRRDQYLREKEGYERELEAFEVARRRAARADEEPPDLPGRPVKPAMGQVFVADVTTERLAEVLGQNPRGVLLIRDELTGWVKALDQYRGGKGADRQFYLSCWSGEPAKVDRKADRGEPLLVLDPVLSVLGCVPPGMLGELDAGGDGEDGFVHRLLFSFPDPVPHRRWSWQGVAPQTVQAWREVVGRLFDLGMGQDESGRPAAVVLDLAPEAMPLWAGWYDRHAAEAEAPDFPEALVGPWSKLTAYAARLALVVHLLRGASGEAVGEEVDPESLRRALRLVAYFGSHARAVYARFRQTGKARQARTAIAWIRAHGGQVRPTDLARNNVAGVERKSEAEALMKELEDRGYGRRERRKSRNHAEVTWFVAAGAGSGPVGTGRVPDPDRSDDTSPPGPGP